METNPFSHLKLDDSSFLDELSGRSQCAKCGRSRRYYCYTCYLPLADTASKYPNVKLPLQVDIIRHPNECESKSTAIHAAILAPSHVRIYTYPSIPDYTDKTKVILVCPGPDAVGLKDLSHVQTHCHSDKSSEEHTSESEKLALKPEQDPSELSAFNISDTSVEATSQGTVQRKRSCDDMGGRAAKRVAVEHKLPVDTVVFIDSTWQQLNKIANDDRLKNIQKVELKTQHTKFWRHQRGKPDTYLATIEAVYYFLCEFHLQFVSQTYSGQYDNMLFLFSYMYSKIKSLYDCGKPVKGFDKE